MSESKSLQISRILLSILRDLGNAIVYMVSARPPISNSSRPFIKLLGIVLSRLITIDIIVTFMFRNFFSSLARSRYLSLFSLSFIFTLWTAVTAKFTFQHVLFFVDYHKVGWSGRVVWSGLGNLFVSQNPREFYASYSLGTNSGLRIYHLFVWWNFNFWHIFLWITFFSQLCRLFLFLC